jgi:hypothetical protein
MELNRHHHQDHATHSTTIQHAPSHPVAALSYPVAAYFAQTYLVVPADGLLLAVGVPFEENLFPFELKYTPAVVARTIL